MSDARYRPPRTAPDLSLTDRPGRRWWPGLLALVFVPVLMQVYAWVEVEARWWMVDNVLTAFVDGTQGRLWLNGLAYAGVFAAVDTAIALLAHRPLVRVYGRWAVVVACVVVLPVAWPQVVRALEQKNALGLAVRSAHVASAVLPLVLLTAYRRRRDVARDR